MIKANELRIGNWVQVAVLANTGTDGIEYWQIDQLIGVELKIKRGSKETKKAYRFITPQGREGELYSPYINPIPLTPEILERCGFEKDDFELQYTLKTKRFGFCIRQDLSTKEWSLFLVDFKRENELARGIGGIKIEFVHQIQNFVFDLTGQELEIKELQHT